MSKITIEVTKEERAAINAVVKTLWNTIGDDSGKNRHIFDHAWRLCNKIDLALAGMLPSGSEAEPNQGIDDDYDVMTEVELCDRLREQGYTVNSAQRAGCWDVYDKDKFHWFCVGNSELVALARETDKAKENSRT